MLYTHNTLLRDFDNTGFTSFPTIGLIKMAVSAAESSEDVSQTWFDRDLCKKNFPNW